MYKSLKINRLCAFFFFFLLFFALIIGLNGCLKEEIKTEAPTRSLFLRYAKNFKIDTLQQGALHVSVQVFIGKDTSTYEYLLLKNGLFLPQTTIIPSSIHQPFPDFHTCYHNILFCYIFLKSLHQADKILYTHLRCDEIQHGVAVLMIYTHTA